MSTPDRLVNRSDQLKNMPLPDLRKELVRVAKTGLQPFGYDGIDFRFLVMGARRMGWQYIPGAYTNEDERVERYSRPAPMNELTLIGTLRYQLGYDYKGIGLPPIPDTDSTKFQDLTKVMGEVGMVLEELYSRDLSQLKEHAIPTELYRRYSR